MMMLFFSKNDSCSNNVRVKTGTHEVDGFDINLFNCIMLRLGSYSLLIFCSVLTKRVKHNKKLKTIVAR